MFNSLLKGLQEQLEQLPQLKEQIAEQINQTISPWMPVLTGTAGEEVQVGKRRLRVLKKLGEGGYSFVYLAEEVIDKASGAAPRRAPRRFALKKVLAGEKEQLVAAQREIETMRKLPTHPNLLPLLGSQIVKSDTDSASYVIYMLFPLMDVNVWDYVQDRLVKEKSPLSTLEMLHLFRQLCFALDAMHTLPSESALSHRDVKPHNILLAAKPPPELLKAAQSTFSASSLATAERSDSAHLVAACSAASSEPTPPLPCAALMDFGSAAPAVAHVTIRSDALVIQEEAERHTTAPYRAPELWDVPSNCTIDCKVDIWAAGCVLYYLIVGETPFERTANEAGGSIMLAIVNGQYSWPDAVIEQYPSALKELADACLNSDPEARPTAAEILQKLELIESEAIS